MAWIIWAATLCLSDSPAASRPAFEFEGFERFPDRQFVACPTDMSGGHTLLRPGERFAFYRFSKPRIWAVPKSTPLDSNWREDPAIPRSEEILDTRSGERTVTRYSFESVEGPRLLLRVAAIERVRRPGGRAGGDAQLLAMLLTLAVETILVCALLRRSLPGIAFIAVGANLVSHPLLWLLLAFFPVLWAGEAGVFLLEAALYRFAGRQRLRTALLVSLLANAVSLGIGLVLAR
jgi:hypothetical protein